MKGLEFALYNYSKKQNNINFNYCPKKTNTNNNLPCNCC